MKFLIITPQMDQKIGGMERFVIEFSKKLWSQGHHVTIFTGKSKNPINAEYANIVRKKIFFPKIFNKLIKYIHLSFLAMMHLKKNKYDSVIAMGFSGVFLDDFVWRASGCPISLVYKIRKKEKRNIFSKMGIIIDVWLQEILERKCITKAKQHMFPSLALKREFEKIYKIKSDSYFIPCSGVGCFPSGKDVYDWKKIKDKKKILIVGGLSEERKGAKIIIDALKKTDLAKSKVIVAGDIGFSLPEEIMPYVVKLGSVHHEDMQNLYSNCDFLIFPSLYEGFPNVLLEAARCGLPIISSRLEGIDEYFKKDSLLLIDKNDAQQLAKAISLLSKSEELRQKLSKNAEKDAEKLDYDAFAENFKIFCNENKNMNMLEREK